MMDYVQMTLDDWLMLKDKLKMELVKTQEGFVRIGYLLRKIDEQKLYEQDGYDNLREFARLEYGLDATTVSRFMNINRKYSIDGYSDRLRPEFIDLGSSKLSEMLSLPDGDLEMVRPEMSRAGIRELKQFNKAEADEATSEWDELVKKFFEDNWELLEEIYDNKHKSEKELAELVNPSGNRIYKKGLFFLSMYEDCIKIKKFGGQKLQTIQWQQFFDDTWRLFGEELKKEKLSTKVEEEVEIEGEPEEPEETGKNESQNDAKEGKKEQEKTLEKTAEPQQTLGFVAPAQLPKEAEEKEEELEEIETITAFEKIKNMDLDELAEWGAYVGCPPGRSCGGSFNHEACCDCWRLYLNQYEMREVKDVFENE